MWREVFGPALPGRTFPTLLSTVLVEWVAEIGSVLRTSGRRLAVTVGRKQAYRPRHKATLFNVHYIVCRSFGVYVS